MNWVACVVVAGLWALPAAAESTEQPASALTTSDTVTPPSQSVKEDAPPRTVESEQPQEKQPPEPSPAPAEEKSTAPAEEKAPAPADEKAPAPVEETESSRVLNLNRAPPTNAPVVKPPSVPPAPAKPKSNASVKRGPDGKVVVPQEPQPMGDPIRPRASTLTSVDRALLTTGQLLSGLAPGGMALVLSAGAFPLFLSMSLLSGILAVLFPGVPVLALAPFISWGLGGVLWGGLSLVHAVLTSVAVMVPTSFEEADPVAGAASLAGVLAVNGFSLVVGGLTATAILLRWPRSLEDAQIPPRFGINPKALTPTGLDMALGLNLMAAVGMAAFLAPLAGVLTYSAASYLRGIPEEAEARERVKARLNKAGSSAHNSQSPGDAP